MFDLYKEDWKQIFMYSASIFVYVVIQNLMIELEVHYFRSIKAYRHA